MGVYFSSLPPYGGIHEVGKKFMEDNGFTIQKDGTPFNFNVKL
jgi:hypothetical protein